jgi:hypothetical protein
MTDLSEASDDPIVTMSRIKGLFAELAIIQSDPMVGIDKPREVCWWLMIDLLKMHYNHHGKSPTKMHMPKAYEAALSKPVTDRTGVPLREMTKLLGMDLVLDADKFLME